MGNISISEDDFSRAKMRAHFEGLLSHIMLKNNELMSLYEVTSIIKPDAETYLGMRTIPVSRIIGSEGRYHDFSKAFYPKKEMLRNRWSSVDRAFIDDIVLPPISVYSLGGWYFVRDGNHRVSVAKAKGAEFIDAEVVELDSKIPLEPGMTMDKLRKRVVEYERNRFIDQYKPSYLPMGDIVFTTPGSYPEMVNHILVHKYYINQDKDRELTFEEAAISWYRNVYSPIVGAIRAHHLLADFPGQSEGDMYMWLVRRWDEGKKQQRDLTVDQTALQAKKEAVKGKISRYINYVASKLSKH